MNDNGRVERSNNSGSIHYLASSAEQRLPEAEIELVFSSLISSGSLAKQRPDCPLRNELEGPVVDQGTLFSFAQVKQTNKQTWALLMLPGRRD